MNVKSFKIIPQNFLGNDGFLFHPIIQNCIIFGKQDAIFGCYGTVLRRFEHQTQKLSETGPRNAKLFYT